MNQNVLITGGCGFIGSHLVESLSTFNYNITVLDDLSTGKYENIQHVPNIKFIQASLADHNTVTKSLKDIDLVCHLAAIPSVMDSIDYPFDISATNVYDSVFLMEEADRAGVKRFVLSSSASVYGNCKVIPATESLPIEPLSPYAASKASLELFARSFAECYNMDTVSLRYFNVYGLRQSPNSPYSGVITKMFKCLNDNSTFNVFGDGEQTRDYVYVKDVAEANICALRSIKRLNGVVVNIGSGIQTSLNDLIDLIGIKNIEYKAARIGEIKHSLADISLANKLLVFKPQVQLEQGLKELI